jgi:hypothetical protein
MWVDDVYAHQYLPALPTFSAGSEQTSLPGFPTNLTATPGNAQVALNWTAPAGATSYNLYRGTTAGGEGTSPYMTGLTATTFTDTGLSNGTTYFYQVTAVNSNGESARSAEVQATPASTSQAGTALAVGSASGVYGGTATLTATLTSGGSPVGNESVLFTLNGNSVGTATTNGSGVATLPNVSLAGIAAGTYAGGVAASFTGDANYTGSSGSNSLVVSKAGTATTLNASATGTVARGTSVTFTATVTDPVTGLVPTDQVQFWDGTTLLATVTLNGNGVASWTTEHLKHGSNHIKAVYLGTTNFLGSTSNTLTLKVV